MTDITHEDRVRCGTCRPPKVTFVASNGRTTPRLSDSPLHTDRSSCGTELQQGPVDLAANLVTDRRIERFEVGTDVRMEEDLPGHGRRLAHLPFAALPDAWTEGERGLQLWG